MAQPIETTSWHPGERMTTLLAAHSLCVGYGSVPVLEGLDLHVDEGEVVALMGSNGAGKTTTLMALAGRLAPASGTIECLGRSVRSPLHRRARAGLRYVPEERVVIRGLSTLDNLRLGPGPVDHALEFFPELRPLLKRSAGLLSGGEQKILTLARALAGDAKILLADELSLGLAPMVVQRLLEAVRAAAHRGVGVLLVEQQVRSALDVADRGYVLRRGSIALDGSSADLRSRLGEIEATYLAGVTPS
jgi:branched-chain amino acid transport system ATP-binding protein